MRRRQFLKVAATSMAAPTVIPRGVLASVTQPGANDRISVAVIGCGGRVVTVLAESPPDLQLVAIADCDLRQMSDKSSFGRFARTKFLGSPNGPDIKTTTRCSTRQSSTRYS